jgi:hypothetical protein
MVSTSKQLIMGLLALRNLGNRHHGRPIQGTRMIQIHVQHNRHVHQVDGSYTSCKHHTRSSSQVHAKYHIQVQRTQVGPHR